MKINTPNKGGNSNTKMVSLFGPPCMYKRINDVPLFNSRLYGWSGREL